MKLLFLLIPVLLCFACSDVHQLERNLPGRYHLYKVDIDTQHITNLDHTDLFIIIGASAAAKDTGGYAVITKDQLILCTGGSCDTGAYQVKNAVSDIGVITVRGKKGKRERNMDVTLINDTLVLRDRMVTFTFSKMKP